MTDRGNVVRLPVAPSPILSPIKLRYPSEIEGPPPPPIWICDGMLLAGTVCLMTGASKTGKSLATQQLLTAIALGREWMGRSTVQTRALAMFCEDRPDQLDRRQLAIAEHYEIHTSQLEMELAWDAREDRDSVLWETEFGKGRPTEFWHQLFGGRSGQRGIIAEDGYRVILLDTAAAMFRINHNDTGQVNAAMRALVREAVRLDIVIIVNAHPSKSGPTGYGGSAQWIAASRFGFNLARPRPPEGVDEEDMAYGDFGLQRVFRGLGSAYVATQRPEKWRWQDGVFVLDEMDSERQRKKPLTEQGRRELEYRLLMGLKRAMQNGVQVPADEMASRSLANLARRCSDPEINRVPLNDLYLSQANLLESGMIVRVNVRGKCLVRPHDGPYYDGESEWQPIFTKEIPDLA